MKPYIKNKRVSWGRIKRLRDKFKDAEAIGEIKGQGHVIRYVQAGKVVLQYEVK